MPVIGDLLTLPDPVPSFIRPSVEQVGALLASRKAVPFTDKTRPTAVQVASIIETVSADVDSELLGRTVTAKLTALATTAVTYAAAATVELTFFPEQEGGVASTGAVWWSRYQQTLARFRELLAEEGGGPQQVGSVGMTSPTLGAFRRLTGGDPTYLDTGFDDVWW